MSLSDALKEKILDVRLRDKLVAEGKVTEEEVRKYLAELPDDQENMTILGSGTATEQ